MTRVGTITNFPSTIISSPPRSTRCVRAVCSCSSPRIIRWTRWIQRCANCWRQVGISRRNPSAQHRLQEKRRHGSDHRHRDAPQTARGRTATWPGVEGHRDFANERGEKFLINEYFATHPHMMLGTMRLARGMYRQGEPGWCRTTGSWPTRSLKRWPGCHKTSIRPKQLPLQKKLSTPPSPRRRTSSPMPSNSPRFQRHGNNCSRSW